MLSLDNSASVPEEKFELLRGVGRVSNNCVNLWSSVRVNQAFGFSVLKNLPKHSLSCYLYRRKPNITFLIEKIIPWFIVFAQADELIRSRARVELCNGQLNLRKILTAPWECDTWAHICHMWPTEIYKQFSNDILHIPAFVRCTSALLLAVLSNSFKQVWFKYLNAFPFLRSPGNTWDNDFNSFFF